MLRKQSVESRYAHRQGRRLILLAALAWMAVAASAVQARQAELLSKADPEVSVDTAGGDSIASSLSADGRYLTFVSDAINLVPGQQNGSNSSQVFLFDRVSGLSTLVSHKSGSRHTSSNNGVSAPEISADGRFVLYASGASDLVPSQVGRGLNLFLWDRENDRTVLVSHAADSSRKASIGEVQDYSLSADGRFVAFSSDGDDLVSGLHDANGGLDVFLWDRVSDTTILVSHQSVSLTSTGDQASFSAQVSGDGSWVAFASGDTNLVTGQTGDFNSNVFLFNCLTREVTLVSHTTGSALHTGNSFSFRPVLSNDGSRVAFESLATDLVPNALDVNEADDVFLYDRIAGTIALVSHTAGSAVTAGNDLSSNPKISSDGRFVAFNSAATDLIAGEMHPGGLVADVILYDGDTTASVLVNRSASSPLLAANGLTGGFELDPTGRFLAFLSYATDLVAGQSDTNGGCDAFLFDRITSMTALVSRASTAATAAGNGTCDGSDQGIAVSSGAAFVAFASTSTDLEAGLSDGNQLSDVFLFDRLASTVKTVSRRDPHAPSRSAGGSTLAAPSSLSANGRFALFLGTIGQAEGLLLSDRKEKTTTLVTHTSDSLAVPSTGFLATAAISADGRSVVFEGNATDLVAGAIDTNGTEDIFLWNQTTGEISLVSHAAASLLQAGNGSSTLPSISANGRFVTFVSDATDLVAGVTDANGAHDVFLWDRTTGGISLVSHVAGLPTTAGNGTSFSPSMSSDGRFVVFEGTATDLVPGQTSSAENVFVFDRTTGTTVLVSHHLGSVAVGSDGDSVGPVISFDGRWIAYSSYADDLIAAQQNTTSQSIFLWDQTTGTNALVSHASSSAAMTANADSANPLIAADGSVAFLSTATDLVGGQDDTNGASDLFLYSPGSGTNSLVSRVLGTQATAAGVFPVPPSISRDGRSIAFTSQADNLVALEGQPPVFLNVYVFHRETSSVELVSHTLGSSLTPGNEDSETGEISADGGCLTLQSFAWDLVVADRDGLADVFESCGLR